MTTYDDARSATTELHACKMPSNCISSGEKEASSVYEDIDCNKPTSVGVVPAPIKSVTSDSNVSVADDIADVQGSTMSTGWDPEYSFQECKLDGDHSVSHNVHDVEYTDSCTSNSDNLQPLHSRASSEVLGICTDLSDETCDHAFEANRISDPEKMDAAIIVNGMRLEIDGSETAGEATEDSHLVHKLYKDNEDFSVSAPCPSNEVVNEFSESVVSSKDGINTAYHDSHVNEMKQQVTYQDLALHDGYDDVESETASAHDSHIEKADSDVNEKVPLPCNDEDVVVATLDVSESEVSLAEPHDIDMVKDCALPAFDHTTEGKYEYVPSVEMHKLESNDISNSSCTVVEHADSSQCLTKSTVMPLLNIPCADSEARKGSVEFSILPLSSPCKDSTTQILVSEKQEVFTIQPAENCPSNFSDVSLDESESAVQSENTVGSKVLPACQPLANSESNSTLPSGTVALNDSLVQSILCDDDDDDDLKNETGQVAVPCSPHRQLGVSFSSDAGGASFKVVRCPGLDAASISSADTNLDTVELDGSGGFVEINLHSSGGSDRFDQINDAGQVNSTASKSGGLAGFLSR
jgi:hypothetical protein